MRKVIVSGATGFVGKWLVKELLKEEIEVYALVRNAEKLAMTCDSLHVICCDMEHISDVVGVIKSEEIDTFYHLAWEGSTGDKRADYGMQLRNVRFSCDALKAAKDLGCKRFFAAGTITEQIVCEAVKMKRVSPNLMYGICKITAHDMLMTLAAQLGIEMVWLQFSNVFGAGNNTGNLISYTLSAIKKGQRPEYSTALQPYDFIYIKDLVRAIVMLGQNELSHNQYFLGSGQSRILKEYLLAIPKALGIEVEMGIGIREDDGLIYQKEWFSIEALTRDTGFKAEYDFEKAIEETYRSW